MKQLMFVATVALCATLAIAEETAAPATPTPAPAAPATPATSAAPTAEAKRQRRRATAEEIKARRAARIAAEGGLVSAPVQGRAVRILNKTDKVTIPELEAMTAEITQLLGFVVEVVDSDQATTQRTGCLVTLAEQNGAPTILVAPEEPWASINVKNLMKDNPTPEVLKTRIRKELWRAFAFAMGASNSQMQPCLMRPIFSLKDLDAEKVAILSPSPLMGISQTAERLNFATARRVTYKTAVAEGWAPAPTNDVQRAICEKVKAEQSEKPSNPLKIRPGDKPAK
ncbi:MAG: hypothetical protein ACI4RD_01290 [Kiritimatiellia bacterium]